ncbi:chemotaxis protein CheW [Caryophanon latum]|uniref:Chemotaxis protein CheA n=1 Tax=Caryophanon latum TaxID=33977 RepID=A0A1C0YZD9_9BACL|nr:chemotaxis protein CheW [Caryophanon latum]OCS92511.1 hypothetical protein A6K76_06395 [Caryophanon latum]
MGGFDLSDYLGVFLDEVDEQLQILDSEILMLEKDPFNEKTIQVIFRAAHTLKGSSAAMGFEKMKELTHHLENIFDNIRQNKMTVTTSLVGLIFSSTDLLRQLKEEIVAGASDVVDIEPMLRKLKLQHAQKSGQTEGTNEAHKKLALDEYQQLAVNEAVAAGQHVYDIHITLADDCVMKSVRALVTHNHLAEHGDIVVIEPAVEAIEAVETFDGVMQCVFVTNDERQSLDGVLNQLTEIKACTVQQLSEKVSESVKQPEAIEPADKVEKVLPPKLKVPATVRVDVDKLELLMNLVGELVIDQTRLVDVRGRFAQKNIHNEVEFEMLDDVTNHLNRVVSELQEGMMKTRMMPIEQLFNRFPRMVRDTANTAHKEIDFIIEGKETDLDRTLIEEIGDPIIHLLRNSIDHGIELPEERLAQRKPRKGRVVLRAAHEENHVVITITDDGKGIDVDKVKQSSVNRGLLTAEAAERLSEKEALFLIFSSGVSTAQKVTELSGRGVGMDIVKSHIEKLNGIIDIESTPGQGTVFTIQLPLTLAIIRSLLVKFADRTFAIPLANVIEIVRLNQDEIQEIQHKEVGVIRGSILPLIRMDEVLHVRQPEERVHRKREFVIVVGVADKRIGLIAERMIGNQEIVIKSLGSYIGTPKHISGATIMGDGSVALILDVASVIKEQGAQTIESHAIERAQQIVEDNELVTFMCKDEAYGIDIQYVKDIIAVKKLTSVANASNELLGILQLRGNMMSVFDLRALLHVTATPQTKKSRIIIIDYNGVEFGLLVDEVAQVLKLGDVQIEEVQHSARTTQTNIIQGVTQLQQRAIFILALEKIVATVVLER